jgi:hypothetical protein
MNQGNRCVWFTEETSVRNLAWLRFKFSSIFQLIQSNSLLSWTILKSGGSTSPMTMRQVLKGLSHQLDTGSITGMVDQAGVPRAGRFSIFSDAQLAADSVVLQSAHRCWKCLRIHITIVRHMKISICWRIRICVVPAMRHDALMAFSRILALVIFVVSL